MNEYRDERQTLINEICMYLMASGCSADDAKDALYVILNKYEITGRCTELAELQEDRNALLLKKFIIAKTVKGCSPNTLSIYKNELERILERIGKTVDDITSDDIRYYLAARQRIDRISKVTADNERRFLRTFYQFLVAEELVTKDPTARVDRVKCNKGKKEAFTDVEIERIRINAEGEREQAIVEMLLSTGARVAELVQIRLSEINGNKVLVHGKGAKDRYVYLNARAQVMLERYLGERKDDNPYVFAGGRYEISESKTLEKGQGVKSLKEWWKRPENVTDDTHLTTSAVENMMRKIAKRAGIEKANPHKFRRTCATLALRRGMPLEQVSKMLGHVEIATTQIYLDLTEDELEAAHKKYVT